MRVAFTTRLRLRLALPSTSQLAARGISENNPLPVPSVMDMTSVRLAPANAPSFPSSSPSSSLPTKSIFGFFVFGWLLGLCRWVRGATHGNTRSTDHPALSPIAMCTSRVSVTLCLAYHDPMEPSFPLLKRQAGRPNTLQRIFHLGHGRAEWRGIIVPAKFHYIRSAFRITS